MASDAILKKGKILSRTFLDYEISETPPWGDGEIGKVDEMIGEIVHLKRLYPDNSLNKNTLMKFRDKFVLQMCHDEGVGLQDREELLAVTREEYLEPTEIVSVNILPVNVDKVKNADEKALLETKNMLKAWRFLETLRNSNCESVLTQDIILQCHQILMNGLSINPGQLSEYERYTRCPVTDAEIRYPSPWFVKVVLPTLLDYANHMAYYLRDRLSKESPTEEIVRDIVKFCAWFFASLVQLHPFGDGNGRISRLLYFYIQSLLSPFAVGVYNIFAPTTKIDYYRAICSVREENRTFLEREENEFYINNWRYGCQPEELARMMLESQWNSWKKIDEFQHLTYKRSLSTELVITPEQSLE